MEIKIKYFDKEYPRLEKIPQGDWIDLRIDSVKLYGDRYNDNAEEFEYKKGDIVKFGLGIAMELPEGYEAEIRPRSSTFKKYGLIQTNSVGTIDNSYKGDNDEWMIEFIAMKDGSINRFDRVCQFRIWENQPEFRILEVEHLRNENRDGYGSTGR